MIDKIFNNKITDVHSFYDEEQYCELKENEIIYFKMLIKESLVYKKRPVLNGCKLLSSAILDFINPTFIGVAFVKGLQGNGYQGFYDAMLFNYILIEFRKKAW